jgi:rhamnosyltransferase
MRFTADNVCAVVVTYYPDSNLPERLRNISEQVDRVIIVDNGTTGRAASTIAGVLGVNQQFEAIKNPENFGVATALNQGVRRALQYGYPWIATFDQDSRPSPHMVERMLECWERGHDRERVVLIGPEVEIRNYLPTTQPSARTEGWEEVNHVITSGSLIARQAFETAGYFLDSLFIDYIDIEYCLRLRDRGYKVMQVKNAVLYHKLGDIVRQKFLWKTVYPSQHPAIRRYYQFRNTVILDKLYKKKFPEWCKTNRIILIKLAFIMLMYEKDRARKLLQIVRGTWHGLRGRVGRRGELDYRDKH